MPSVTTVATPIDYREWSPDGQHIIGRTTDGIAVFDLIGSELASIPFSEGHWTSATSFAGFGSPPPGPVTARVRFFDLTGSQTDEVPADFEAVRFAPASQVFAGIIPGGSDSAIGKTYRVWDGSGLSKIRDGVPLAWSADTSMLGVLTPLQGGGYGGSGLDGTPAVVDASGGVLFELPGWAGDAYGIFRFSPDGAYAAACLAAADGSDPSQIRVIDVKAKAIVSSLGKCGIASWSASDALLSADGIAAPTLWTPTAGPSNPGLGDQTWATISADGKIASWPSSGGSNSVRVTDGQSTTEYEIANAFDGAVWSPDGSLLGVGSPLTIIAP